MGSILWCNETPIRRFASFRRPLRELSALKMGEREGGYRRSFGGLLAVTPSEQPP